MTTAQRIEYSCRYGLTFTICLSSTVLMLAEGSFFPVGLTPFIALAALWLNDHRRLLVLPVLGANLAGMLSIGIAIAELSTGGTETRILAMVHLVAYLTWTVLFMDKQDRQMWWLLALSVLHLALATTLTRSPLLGPAMVTLLVVEIWTLTLFTLHRLHQRLAIPGGGSVEAQRSVIHVRYGMQTDSGVDWLGSRLRMTVAAMCAASLLMSGVVFAVFPRVFVGTPFSTSPDSASMNSGIINRTGFRETVRLGEFGIILPSDERVLQLEFIRQQTGESVNAAEFSQIMEMEELLLRGTVMGIYADGEWRRSKDPNRVPVENPRRQFTDTSTSADCFRVRIIQDPPVGTFAFAPSPVVAGRLLSADGRLRQREYSRSLVFDLDSSGTWSRDQNSVINDEALTFEVFCPVLETQRKETPPPWLRGSLRRWLFPDARGSGKLVMADRHARRFDLTPSLNQTMPRLHRLAHDLCRSGNAPVDAADSAEKIVNLLRNSGEYTYSLTMPENSGDQDPVEEFLLSTKTGHCQYFASAAALMLQSLDIPARIVNGFKGSEENPLTGRIEVRQKHAHVWVEYWDNLQWHRIDPTPGTRDDVVAATQGATVLSNLQNAVTDLWQSGLNNVTADRQREFIAPVLEAFQELVNESRRRGFGYLVLHYARLFLQDPARFLSLPVILGLLTAVVVLTVVTRRYTLSALRWIFDWFQIRRNPRRRASTTIVRFYETFRKVCAKEGFHFEASNTAVENSRNAGQYFADRLSAQTEAIPQRIADAFNAVRYGGEILSEEQAAALGDELGLLTAQIRKPASKPDDKTPVTA